MLDCYDCNKEKLKDEKFVLEFLDKLPGMIKMEKIAPPFLINFPGKTGTFDKGGISAVVLISTSHISIHTFPHNNYMSIDIFSCKNFDIEKTIKIIENSFGVKKFEKRLVMRGSEFPKDTKKLEKIIENQRKKSDLKP
jgi:S-adenosylmethionine decarboxylase